MSKEVTSPRGKTSWQKQIREILPNMMGELNIFLCKRIYIYIYIYIYNRNG